MEEIISTIVGLAFGILILGLFVFGFLLCIKWDSIRDYKRDEFIKTLDEHDKAVVCNYCHIHTNFSELFRRSKKNG